MSVLEKFNTAVNEAIELISQIKAEPHQNYALAGSDRVNVAAALNNIRDLAAEVISSDAESCTDAFEDCISVAELVSETLTPDDSAYDELAMEFFQSVHAMGRIAVPVPDLDDEIYTVEELALS